MSAYERYLVKLSNLYMPILDKPQQECLEIVLKTCILDQQDSIFEVMQKYGHETYTSTSFTEVANKLIEQYDEKV